MTLRVVIDTNISGDNDLRADEVLRKSMDLYFIELLGVNSFLKYLE
jgi:hypothetical protein